MKPTGKHEEGKAMRFTIRVLLFVLCWISPAWGQSAVKDRSFAGRVGHYITTHKTVLVLDTLIVFAQAADAASSVHCQHVSPQGCIERNSLLGPHPSPAAAWGLSMGYASSLVAANHLWWWATGKWNEKDLRPLMGMWVAPVAVFQVFNVKDNVDGTEYLENRQVHLPRVRLPHYRP
jgi:hypothetical protein